MVRPSFKAATPQGVARVAVDYGRCVVRAQRVAGEPVTVYPLAGGTLEHASAVQLAGAFLAGGYLRAVVWRWQGSPRS